MRNANNRISLDMTINALGKEIYSLYAMIPLMDELDRIVIKDAQARLLDLINTIEAESKLKSKITMHFAA